MDFNSLTPENQEKYLALEKQMFSNKSLKLYSVCKKLRIPYYEGFMWWSNMIQRHPSPIPKPPIYSKKQTPQTPAPDTCPTCGKLKNEVTDIEICRDVFHYI